MKFDFLLSDVDGTLFTPDHQFTPRSRAAIKAFRAAGGRFTVASSRPPLGMRKIVKDAGVDLPFAAFNGGLILQPDFTVLEQHALTASETIEAIKQIRAHGLEAWLYRGMEWWVTNPQGDRVAREAASVQFEPMVTPHLEDKAEGALKLVGVSLNTELVARAEQELRERWQGTAEVSRSHATYVDVTHLHANKGFALRRLAELAGSHPERAATIGDMTNDIEMFKVSAFSIAMGNAPEHVRARASVSTSANTQEGFAAAVERYLLV